MKIKALLAIIFIVTSALDAKSLSFKPSSTTYQPFGTSEIHGHVEYFTPSGYKLKVHTDKIYLIPSSKEVAQWYKHSYIKNKQSSKVFTYINSTRLDLDNNFSFYGLPKGIYYIIVQSNHPNAHSHTQYVYSAKRIVVKPYQNILALFTKKL